jgi:hypothetical protein
VRCGGAAASLNQDLLCGVHNACLRVRLVQVVSLETPEMRRKIVSRIETDALARAEARQVCVFAPILPSSRPRVPPSPSATLYACMRKPLPCLILRPKSHALL